LGSADIPAELRCYFECDGTSSGPVEVLDLAAAGFGLVPPTHLPMTPGSVLESFELRLGDRSMWRGSAVVVRGGNDRVGGRFTSGVLDLQQFRLGITFEGRLTLLGEQRKLLPPEWRAAIADLRQLLEDAKFELEETERSGVHDPTRRSEEEEELFEKLRARWGGAFLDSLIELHAMSKSFDARTASVGQAYACAMLMPLLNACPMHRRAYEKPLGYAGDYRMMELYFARDLGEGLFGRFLYTVTKEYSLVQAVINREAMIRRAVEEASSRVGDGPVRVLSLAAGPAIELRRFIEATNGLSRPVELILLDQDPKALESAHGHLTRLLLERHYGTLPVSVRCLHFSVRQLLKPQTVDECRIVRETLAALDLVYSAGLYDYLPQPVATRLTELTYSKLRPGGRLFHGNLVEAPDTTWTMDYVLGWRLIYRTDAMMLALADGLTPQAESVRIARDTTERAIFLDVRRGDSPSLT
jgi:extracellular factor (EF) 3-hydroxypalmitic acid methyl ester biosynthesis protein